MVIDVDAWKAIGVGLGTVVAAYLGRRKMKMTFSSDSVKIEGDEATKNVYHTLRSENDRLRLVLHDKDETIRVLTDKIDRAYAERNAAIIELGTLKVEAQMLRDQSRKLEDKIRGMQVRIESLLGGKP